MIAKVSEEPVTVCDLDIDQVARVQGLRGPAALCQRLGEMGLTEGSAVRVVRTTPFGGPIQINVRNYNLCLRRDEGRCVLVECSEDPARCGTCALNCVNPPIAKAPTRRSWARYIGAGAFLFFAIKGMLWLLIPLGLIFLRYFSD